MMLHTHICRWNAVISSIHVSLEATPTRKMSESNVHAVIMLAVINYIYDTFLVQTNGVTSASMLQL